jgi:tetratricopeptide (TPR) repeat protein
MKSLIQFILILFLMYQGNSVSQSAYDSLVMQLSNPLHDTARIDLLNRIAAEAIYVEPELVHQYSFEALEMSEKIGYIKGMAEAGNNMGSYLRHKGLYAEAMDHFFKSLELMESIQYTEGIARSHNMFGILYYLLENYDNAIKHYEVSLQNYQEIDDKKWIAGISNNIGMIHELKGNYKEALEYYWKSLEISMYIENQKWLAINFSNIGSLYLTINNPLSLYYFQRSLDIRKNMADTIGMAFSNYMLGKYYVHEKQFTKSIPFLKESLEVSNKTGNTQFCKLTTEQLSFAYAGSFDYRNAYEYHLLFKMFGDRLELQSSTERITRLNYMHAYRKNKQIAEIKHERARMHRLIFSTALGLVFLGVVLIYFRQRSTTSQQRLNKLNIRIQNEALEETIKFKEKLLEDNINYLINKNELLTQVIEQLSEIKSQLKPVNHSVINQLVMDLKGGIQDESEEEFEVRFNQIHQDFYSNLKAKFPELSANETKLCAFLRLKMTSREISTLTGQSVNSIEIARSRLRKKLMLSGSDTNLVDYLLKL